MCYNACMQFPEDPTMLYSFLNTKLRDEYSDLAALCDDLEADTDALLLRMREAGLRYNTDANRVEFV